MCESPYRMCPPNGLPAFGTRAMKTPPAISAVATRSRVSSTSGFVRCSRRSVATTAGAAGTLRQNLVVVTLPYKFKARRPRDSDLLRTHVDAHGVIAVGKHQPHQLALPAAYVDNKSKPGIGQRRADVAPVDEASCVAPAATSMLRRISGIQPIPQGVRACRASHGESIRSYGT